MKTCGRCKQTKGDSEFSPSSLRAATDGKRWCRACFREYDREHRKHELATVPTWTTRMCSHCHIEKGKADFTPSGWLKTKPGAWCRTCHRAYYKQRAKDEPGYFGRYMQARRQRSLAYVRQKKAELGCSICG